MAARLLFASLPGASVAILLFWFVQYLIASEEYTLPKNTTKYFSLNFSVETLTPPRMQEERQKPKKPEITKKPTTVPALANLQTPTIGEIAINMPALRQMTFDYDQTIALGGSDYLPIMKIAPEYPRRALARGIEGNCMVIYTVTEKGTVDDPKIVENQCDSKLFHKAALRATKKFRYQPRVIDGRPIRVTQVKNNFIFRIAKP